MTFAPELMSAGERLYDYCHLPYEPRGSGDVAGKLRASNLLFRSFEVAGAPGVLFDFVAALRRAFGISEIVFGVKLVGGALSWEYYFYNDHRDGPPIRVSDFLAVAAPYLDHPFAVNERVPYFMFSVDITPSIFAERRLPGVHLYVHGMCAKRGPRALSYLMSDGGITLENHYAFYKTASHIRELLPKIKHSAFVDFDRVKLSELILPELFDCYTICNANKRQTDCLYFSRVDMTQLAFFLRRLSYPEALGDYLRDNAEALSHLRACVGFDYCMGADGRLATPKSGFYGSF